MRFTDGLWMHRSGLSIHNTHQMWEYRIEQDRIKAFVLCHCVEEADDYTAGTALEYTFSCPAPDMIAVDVVHFRGTTVNHRYGGEPCDGKRPDAARDPEIEAVCL